MSREALISTKNARLGYKKSGAEICILKNIDLNFYAGDVIGIVGLNGVGKSTLLKTLCGLLEPLAGEVRITGELITEIALSELAKKIAIVLTEKIGGFNLTAYDLVAAGQMPYTNSFNRLGKKHKEIIKAAIDACGLKEHQFKLINELSDGLFQKTIIAKALAQQTPVLLLDEPSAFLDYASKHDLFLLLKDLAIKENKCVLLSSHDLDLLLKYCSKLLVIEGKSAELIAVEDAKNNAAFLRIGGGYI